MGARFYDPALGRFISPDITPGLNRYAYCLNNPVNAIDPSGYTANLTINETDDETIYTLIDDACPDQIYQTDDLWKVATRWAYIQQNSTEMSQERYHDLIAYEENKPSLLLDMYAD